jgi:hypothetical protein
MNKSAKIAIYLFVFLVISAVGFHLPIYTDEVAFRLIYGRYLADHVISGLIPYCEKVFSVSPPLITIPWRVIDSLTTSVLAADPHFFRYFSLALLSVFIFCFIKLLNSMPKLQTWQTKIDLLTPLALGSTMLYFYYLRVEIILCICLILSIFLLIKKQETIYKKSFLLRTVVTFFIIGTAFVYHPISYFMIPVFLLFIYRWSKNKTEFILMMVPVFAVFYFTFIFNQDRVACGQFFSSENYLFKSETATLFDYAKQFLFNFIDLERYFLNIIFENHSQYGLTNASAYSDSVLFKSYGFFVYLLSTYTSYAILALTVYALFVGRKDRSIYWWSLLCVLISLISFLCLTYRKPPYYILVIFTELTIMLALSIQNLRNTGLIEKIKKAINIYFILFILNSVLILFLYAPQISVWKQIGTDNFRGGSFSHFDFKNTSKKYTDMLAHCNIKQSELEYLVTDDIGILTFWNQMKFPIMRDFILSPVQEKCLSLKNNLSSHFSNFKLNKFILGCRSLGSPININEKNGICCGNAKDLQIHLNRFYDKAIDFDKDCKPRI